MRGHRHAVLAALATVALVGGPTGCDDEQATGAGAVAETFNGFVGGASLVDRGGWFSEPSDVAVYAGDLADPDDDKIFVVEADRDRNARVQRLDRHGNFELAWGADVVRRGAPGDRGTGPEVCRVASACKAAPASSAVGGFRRPTAIAASDATGDVYVMDTGNRRVQRFSADGEPIRAWGRERFGAVPIAGVAVRPAQGDVFATDGANNRVLQFSADGRLLRAWSWPGDRRWAAAGWPRQLTVDREGIVYATDRSRERQQIVRFDSTRPSRASALLAPLALGSHTSMGLEIDAAGDLVTARDRIGPAAIEIVREPGRRRVPGTRTRRPALSFGGFMTSVNGLAVSPTTGSVFLAKGERLNVTDPPQGFSECRAPGGGTRECHGLILAAAYGRRPSVGLDAPSRDDRSARLAGSVTAAGAVTYRFQVARADGPWRDAAPARTLIDADDEPVEALARGLDPRTAYRARLLVTRLTPDAPEVERVSSAELPIDSP